MPDSRSRGLFVLLATLIAAPSLASAPVEVGDPAAAPVAGGEESVAVDLRTVPFYAVDGKGAPVFDLRSDEVELRVDGKLEPIDTFDRHRLDATGERTEPGAAVAPPFRRDVFLLIDQAFLSLAGLRNARTIADSLSASFVPGDRLFLIVNDAQHGFRIVLGPVAGDAAGQDELRHRIAQLGVEHNRLATGTSLPPFVMGSGRNGVPSEQIHNTYANARSLEIAQYRDAAGQLAQALRMLALQLERTGTPKLLVMLTPGLDSELYFEGEVDGTSVASAEDPLAAHVDTRRADPMVDTFAPAFTALAASGTNLVLVNPDGNRQDGRDYLEQMRDKVGGVIVDRAAPGTLAREVARSTAALYVAGFYARPEAPVPAGARIEVVVNRPGVRVLAPRTVHSPRPWHSLDKAERRLAVLDLVQRAAYSGLEGVQPELAARPLQARVQSLGGGEPGAGRQLELVGTWPAELAGHEVEVYEVLLRAPQGDHAPELLSFRESARHAPVDPLELRLTTVPGPQVWAVVLVDPGSGATYLRRLQLTPQPAPPPSR